MDSNTKNLKPKSAQGAKILKMLFTNANGSSAEAIKKYQGSGLPSFGIMYPQLKNLAKEYPTDNTIAEYLLDKNTRDAKIMGILLCNPLTINDKFIQKLKEYSNTDELKNITARHIIAPIIKNEGLNRLKCKFPESILIKGIIQSYRLYQLKPDFKKSLNLIMDNTTGHDEILTMDKKTIAMILYREYTDVRQLLICELQKIKNTNLQNLALEWIEDFKYID